MNIQAGRVLIVPISGNYPVDPPSATVRVWAVCGFVVRSARAELKDENKRSRDR